MYLDTETDLDSAQDSSWQWQIFFRLLPQHVTPKTIAYTVGHMDISMHLIASFHSN